MIFIRKFDFYRYQYFVDFWQRCHFFTYLLTFSPDWKWDKFLLLTEYVSVQVLYESKKESDS